MSKLIDAAKSVKPQHSYRNKTRHPTVDVIKLASAVGKGEVRIEQAAVALGVKRPSVYFLFGTAMMNGFRDGLIEIRKEGK